MKLDDWGILEPCSQQDCEKWASSFDYNCHLGTMSDCDNFYPVSEWRRELWAKRELDKKKQDDCIFCDKIADRHFLCDNEECVAFYDEFPVTEGHILIVPKVHTPNFITLTPDEFECINEMVLKMIGESEATDPTISGWNVGWNIGESAGQTIEHAHCHLIPRRDGDCEDPLGGVRGVIDGKRNYKK